MNETFAFAVDVHGGVRVHNDAFKLRSSTTHEVHIPTTLHTLLDLDSRHENGKFE